MSKPILTSDDMGHTVSIDEVGLEGDTFTLNVADWLHLHLFDDGEMEFRFTLTDGTKVDVSFDPEKGITSLTRGK